MNLSVPERVLKDGYQYHYVGNETKIMPFTSSTYLDTAHLLRRAGFGAAPDDVQTAANLGLAATTDRLLNYESLPQPVDDDALLQRLVDAVPEQAKAKLGDSVPIQVVKIWWTYRMLATQRPLEEKMTLFWHNHFPSKDGNQQGDLMLRQNQLYRRNALGNFRTLALEVSKDPEMLRYLNGNENYKAHPNENYARELMELFTCGRVNPQGQPNYTEDDIKNSARAFSGWNLRGQQFAFNPNQHDDGLKTFMGRTGNFNGDDIVDILVSLPATADYLCRKLFRTFAYEDPEPPVMNALIQTYYGSGYDIKAVVGKILRSNAFYSAKARGAVIKNPVEFVIGTVNMAGLAPIFTPPVDQMSDDSPDAPIGRPLRGGRGRYQARGGLGRLFFLVNAMRNMGQSLLEPPSVKGWDGGTLWINTDTIQTRARFAVAISSLPALPVDRLSGGTPAVQAAAFDGGGSDSAKLVDSLLWQFGPLKVSPQTRDVLIQYAQSEPVPERRVRGTMALVLGTQEYQVS